MDRKIQVGYKDRRVGKNRIVQNLKFERRIWDAAVTYLSSVSGRLIWEDAWEDTQLAFDL